MSLVDGQDSFLVSLHVMHFSFLYCSREKALQAYCGGDNSDGDGRDVVIVLVGTMMVMVRMWS